jgi:hypothetical protein
MDIQNEVEKIKQELTELIMKCLQENSMDVTQAQTLAADFLALLPIKDQQDLLVKLKGLGENYSPVKELYVRELGKINEAQREEVLTQMRNAIAGGNIDHAITIAKAVKEQSSSTTI